MLTLRRHLLAVSLLLLAAQAAGLVVLPGRCTCGGAAGASSCGCCQSREAASDIDCPMCKRAGQAEEHGQAQAGIEEQAPQPTAPQSRCKARCCGHQPGLAWLNDAQAVLPGEAALPVLLTPAGTPSLASATVAEAIKIPPSPPPRPTFS